REVQETEKVDSPSYADEHRTSQSHQRLGDIPATTPTTKSAPVAQLLIYRPLAAISPEATHYRSFESPSCTYPQ
ncbi:MAG: hypothetical protein WB780_13820, partial [Candidatus Acidiferrales bacterium]